MLFGVGHQPAIHLNAVTDLIHRKVHGLYPTLYLTPLNILTSFRIFGPRGKVRVPVSYSCSTMLIIFSQGEESDGEGYVWFLFKFRRPRAKYVRNRRKERVHFRLRSWSYLASEIQHSILVYIQKQ